jgi:hypothetical protein
MTTKQKLTLTISSVLVGSLVTIFIYQRIQRAKADASVVTEEEALKILEEKKPTPPPEFSPEDLIPKLPDGEDVLPEDSMDTTFLDNSEYDLGYYDYYNYSV